MKACGNGFFQTIFEARVAKTNGSRSHNSKLFSENSAMQTALMKKKVSPENFKQQRSFLKELYGCVLSGASCLLCNLHML